MRPKEEFGNRCRHQCRTARAQFRGLEHGAIAGSQGADQRHDQQLHRAVPGADDQDDPPRFPNDALPARNRLQPGGLGPHPALEVVERIGGLVGADTQLHEALEFGPRYVRPHGLDHFVTPPFQHLADRLQLPAPPVQWAGAAAVEGTAQVLDGSRWGGGLDHVSRLSWLAHHERECRRRPHLHHLHHLEPVAQVEGYVAGVRRFQEGQGAIRIDIG